MEPTFKRHEFLATPRGSQLHGALNRLRATVGYECAGVWNVTVQFLEEIVAGPMLDALRHVDCAARLVLYGCHDTGMIVPHQCGTVTCAAEIDECTLVRLQSGVFGGVQLE